MRCHYTFDKEKNKVLIPGCMAVAHSHDISDCTCSFDLTPSMFEHKQYKHTVDTLRLEIEDLKNEIECLHKIIENEDK